ncbi:glycoside hydrolase family 88/105 protein [Glaciecola petra]|uniref:Glycoside hydrolase family 88 protein n=1 Tax=Glaciecola petra TaxID=3075602 RepID=A0ABU2ZUN1_9ALTE|nr:glycoside hydrolase family 88 protein [Aestuariibacter sp. P117]MDT0595294.1 glycoside hydrolase family 88 protein [Aestuariibacter sp. P117]
MKKPLLTVCLSTLFFLNACSEVPKETSLTSSTETLTSDLQQSSTNMSEAEKRVQTAVDNAAKWQLARMDNFDTYIPTFLHRTVEERGWVQGAFYLGLVRWAMTTNNQEYLGFLRDHGEAQNWRLGDRTFHADDHVIAQYYLYIYDQDQNPKILEHNLSEFEIILDENPQMSLDFGPRGKIADLGYDHDCQKRWCWSDALFMSPPVWVHLSNITGDDKYAAYSHKEYQAVTDYLLDPEYNLYFRDSRFLERRESDGTKIFWSRGNGWVYSGLANIIDIMDKNDPRRDWYIDLFKRMSSSLKDLQNDSGYWPVSLAAGHLYPTPESSGTAFFVAGMAWGINNNILDEALYLPSVKKGWDALLKAQKEDGMLGYVQQVGYAPDKVSPDETQLYGAGAFLLAGSEVLKLADKL